MERRFENLNISIYASASALASLSTSAFQIFCFCFTSVHFFFFFKRNWKIYFLYCASVFRVSILYWKQLLLHDFLFIHPEAPVGVIERRFKRTYPFVFRKNSCFETFGNVPGKTSMMESFQVHLLTFMGVFCTCFYKKETHHRHYFRNFQEF